MVRSVTQDDIPLVLDIARRFHSYSPWRDMPFSDEAVVATVGRLVADPAGVCLTNGTGIIGGMVAPIYFGGGLAAQELFWFADENGRELVEAFEEWAQEQGAAGVMMMSLAVSDEIDGRMERLYHKRGYALRERSYWKGLR